MGAILLHTLGDAGCGLFLSAPCLLVDSWGYKGANSLLCGHRPLLKPHSGAAQCLSVQLSLLNSAKSRH